MGEPQPLAKALGATLLAATFHGLLRIEGEETGCVPNIFH